MEIVLVRHAEPEWVVDGYQVDNPPLTERGRLQAELLGERLARETFDEVYVSPLVRPRETVRPYLVHSGHPEVIAAWLEEIRNPVWAGTPAEKADEAYRQEWSKPSHERWHGIPGGENVRDFVTRIRRGAAEFLAEHGIALVQGPLPVWRIEGPARKILLIAHAGTNSVTIAHLLGLEPVPWEWDRFVLGHASITRLEALQLGDGHTFSLTRLGDVEHLPDDLRTR